jgi:hypothetical protein
MSGSKVTTTSGGRVSSRRGVQIVAGLVLLGTASCLSAASGGGGVDGATSVDDDGGAAADYPTGPYGKQVGEVFPRMTFLDEGGEVVDLADDYLGTLAARVIFGTTSWCAPCIPDAEYLHERIQEDHPDVAAYGVLTENPHGDDATAQDAENYNSDVLAFEFLADPGRVLEDVFFVASAYPRVAVLATDTMQIVYIGTGHDMDAVLDAL